MAGKRGQLLREISSNNPLSSGLTGVWAFARLVFTYPALAVSSWMRVRCSWSASVTAKSLPPQPSPSCAIRTRFGHGL